MWGSNSDTYKQWRRALGNPEFDLGAQPLIEWYAKLKFQWDHLVELTCEQWIHTLCDEKASLEVELHDPRWVNKPEYLIDLQQDIEDISNRVTGEMS